jgi:uncharacterized protein with GYD domain
MPTYISFVRFTQSGVEKIKDSPSRLDAARKAFEAAGARIKDFYLVMGQYDIVTVVEAPNDETMAKLALTLGARGTVRTETVRAFTEAEYRSIVAGLP